MSILEDDRRWPKILGDLAVGKDLDADTTSAALGSILNGKATDAQIAGFIVALHQKGETAEELVGLRKAMIDAATPLEMPEGTVDIVGVGGSHSRRSAAMNVSTMAAFVAAGAGAIVCKHGNRKASSTSGSFDFLEALGVNIEQTPEALEAQVGQHGIGFAFARTFHPAMRHVGSVRVELGIPTTFNILGPLSHPAKLSRQVIGVTDWDVAERILRVLEMTGSVRSLVVHGEGGLDELTTTGASRMLYLNGKDVSELLVDPVALGLAPANSDDLKGGNAETNAEIARAIFAGERGPKRDIVVLNAAAGLIVAGHASSLEDGISQASVAIDDGRVAAKVAALTN